ncbi:hypothetical protein H9P43_007942 [Blastocladiella emersonii ATCC 22665]|nr:hypothetical protein H9P43_007942 [Blastocladiella emersonii ATCC 22665]
MSSSMAATATKSLVPLTRLQLLTRLPRSNHRESTIYIKGFLQQGEDPKNFDEWLQSHHLLALSPKHNWDGLSFGYSWNSGALLHPVTLPVPVATLGTVASRLMTLGKLTPAGLLGSLAFDTTLNLGKLAYQFRAASSAAEAGAPALAETLRQLRSECDHVRVVAHSLGCRHLCHALALMHPDERPDTVHLCAPAMTNQFFMAVQSSRPERAEAVERESLEEWGEPDASPPKPEAESFDDNELVPLARRGVYVYWTPRDSVLAVLFRVVALGDLAMGHIGVQPAPPPGPSPEALSVAFAHSEMASRPNSSGVRDVIHLDPDGFAVPPPPLPPTATLESIDVSPHFGSAVRAVHSAYAARFHYFAHEYWHANEIWPSSSVNRADDGGARRQ